MKGMSLLIHFPNRYIHMTISLFLSLYLLAPFSIAAFSAKAPAFNLSDRFKATCPADTSTISQFDPNLVNNKDDGDCTWVSVFRSSNNMPSVLIKDDFLNAMRIATTVQTGSASPVSTEIDNSTISDQIESQGVKAQTPVAIGRLSRSPDFPDTFVIDNMRCSLKKEDTDESCDGDSEHAEAISICIDELILHHLKEGQLFDDGSNSGAIRMKATLHQTRLLEDRGFKEVQSLSRDMATHISNLDEALFKYSERVVETVSKGPGARDRTLKILNYLGKQDPCTSDDEEGNANGNSGDEGGEDEFDPWATVKRYA